MKVKTYTEFEQIFEFKIPNVKIDDFLYNIQVAGNRHKNAILAYYKTFEQYIDCLDKKKHIYKINDLSGDILNSERVVFKSMVFDKQDVLNIKENVVTYALSEFYSDIPDELDIFGIKVKPMLFIDKDNVKITFDTIVTFEQTISIISDISGYSYEGESGGFYIWSDKAQIKNKIM